MDSFRVKEDRCRKDGICAQVCPVRIIKGQAGEIPAIPDELRKRCIACGQCMAFCPTQACAAPGLAFEDLRKLRGELYPTPEQLEELVFARRSIRNFRETQVPREMLVRILDAVRFAPTGQNRQNIRWIVLESREETLTLVKLVIDWLMELPRKDPKLAEDMRASGFVRAWDKGVDLLTRGAPHVAIAVGKRGGELECFNAAAALTYLEILAQAHGLGCCWGGYLSSAFLHPAAEAIRDYLELKPDEQAYSAQMMGYPRFRAVSRPPRNPLRVTWK